VLVERGGGFAMAGGLTKVPAGYTLEYQHKTICGRTPSLA